MKSYVLAIDQGTTSTRAMIFDAELAVRGVAQQEFAQHFPQSGWVEHDLEDIWQSVLATGRAAIAEAGIDPAAIGAIGITNQRETTAVWNRRTGEPVHRAIVWQDRRTAALCERLREEGLEPLFTERTGLLLDPYFSGTKLSWILEQSPDIRKAAERGELAFGTIDSFLIWRLTNGARHVTDATNASRTLLYDIGRNGWDEELCALLEVPAAMLPEVLDCAANFGVAAERHFGAAIPVLGVAGDQQAAALGQACFAPGMIKATYGTGCFILLNTGEDRVTSRHRLLTTLAWRLEGRSTYALEGSIFVAGSAVQWLRDSLGMISTSADSGALADAADPGQDVYLVPAFVGLGAPHWDAEARGAIFGLTRNTGPKEFARAALESVCYQTRDLLEAMRGDWRSDATGTLRVDGGMAASDWTLQRLADLLDLPVDRPEITETTTLGAAWLAGARAGILPGMERFAERWSLERRFTPQMKAEERERKYRGWQDALARTLTRPREQRF